MNRGPYPIRTAARTAVAALAALALAACLPGAPPASPVALETLRRIRAGEYALAASMNPDALNLRSLAAADPGCLYYLGLLAARSGAAGAAESFLRGSWRYESEPWRRLAVGELLRAEAGRAVPSAGAAGLAGEAARIYPDDAELSTLRLELLHRSGRTADFLLEGGALPPARLGAVLHQRLVRERRAAGRPDWRSGARLALSAWSARELDLRLLDELVSSSEAQESFEAWELSFFRLKRALAAGDPRAGLAEYRAARDKLHAHRPAAPVMAELGELFMKNGLWLEGGRELAAAAALSASPSPARTAALLAAGKLFREAGAAPEALRMLETAAGETPAGRELDRVLWHLLATHFRESAAAAVANLETVLAGMSDPGEFSDLFEALSSSLVRGRDWRGLERAFHLLKGRAAGEDQARLAFILGAALSLGYFKPALRETGGAESCLRFAAAKDDRGYYRLLASIILGEQAPGPVESAGAPGGGRPYSAREALVKGYLAYGLAEAAGREAGRGGRLSAQTLLELAEALAGRGAFMASLRVMDGLLNRPDFSPGARELRLAYPLAFYDEMSSVGARKGLSLPLFYALVREESYFNARIKSAAGAVGLAQLMPATAGELALRLRLPAADLTDPAHNLLLGGQYLRWLMDRFSENGLFALAAYNAGQGRVAAWRKSLAGLPAVLGVEALPFAETREYIRKISLSVARYGQLYWQLPPRESVRLIFPELTRAKS